MNDDPNKSFTEEESSNVSHVHGNNDDNEDMSDSDDVPVSVSTDKLKHKRESEQQNNNLFENISEGYEDKTAYHLPMHLCVKRPILFH